MPMPGSIPRYVDGFWLALLAITVLAGAGIVPFHDHESTFVLMGKDYHALFADGDLSKFLYDARTQDLKEQHRRKLNGAVVPIIYGWVAWNQGAGADSFNNAWRWKNDNTFNEQSGRIPQRQLLNAARTASAVLLRERRWWAYPLLGACMGVAAAKHPNALVAALAFVAVLMATRREQRKGEAPKRGRGLKRPICLLTLPIAATPLPWARYYLPLAPALILLVSHSIFIIVSSLRNRWFGKADGINLLD